MQKDQKLFLGNDAIGLVDLRTKLREAKEANPEVSVYLRADQSVPYGTVVQVMDEIKEANIDKMGIVTSPKTEQIKEDTIGQSS